MSLSQPARDLQTLVLSCHPLIVIETIEEERVAALLAQTAQDMQMPMMEWSYAQGLCRTSGTFRAPWDEGYAKSGNQAQAFDGTVEPAEMLKHIAELKVQAIYWLKDLGEHLRDPKVARHLREVIGAFAQNRTVMVVTGERVELPGAIAYDAAYCDLKLPNAQELGRIVRQVVRHLSAKNRIQIHLEPADEVALVHALSGMTLNQARQSLSYAAMEDGRLDASDVSNILHRKSQIIRAGGLLEYFPVEDLPTALGGFAGLKTWLSRARVGFSPQAQALNLQPPKGILIVGMQGCGKSLAAKAIARAWKMPLLKLDAGRLYNKYVGESESNFRKAVTLAEGIAPAVLWIDEIEKSFGNSGGDGGDGGLSQRLFGSFLTWLQEKSQEVFVVATANDISKIPPELLRKGRFDEIFFVDLPTAAERETILRLHLKKRKQEPQQFDLAGLVAATDGFNGAEIEQAVITALYRALHQQQALETELLITQIREMIPLSVARRADLERLRAIAQTSFVSAS
ncbi:MAG: AAA family ATPase [Synechococcales cyanobacterium RM1_1_8]|nr:AAA family ATPase [Synechococcales cyanobacterium RM1_1_8]